jgi:hypothetical protein
MKNIHILPTTESRLHHYYSFTPQYALSKEPLNWRTASHIYITSDEEIKKGDWFIDENENAIYYMMSSSRLIYNNCKKIILTTDPTLIADGVQSIDDEFLEWFVKNPTCEFVEVQKWTNYSEVKYKLIIPQEEPKQEFLLFDKEKANTITSEGQKTVRELQNTIQQETLEEAAKEFYPPTTTDLICSPKLVRDAFIAGANYQAQRMYSEQIELINWLQQSLTAKKFYSTDAEDLIKQFKKK